MGWVLSNVAIRTLFFLIFIGCIWGFSLGHQKFKIVNSYSLESHLLEKEDVGLVLALCSFRKKKWTTVFFPATQCASNAVRQLSYLLVCSELFNSIVEKKRQRAALQRNVLSHDKDHSSPTRSVFVVGPQQVRKTCGLMRTPTHTHRVPQASRVWTEHCNYSHSVASAYAPQATSPSHYQKWGFIILMMHRLKAAAPAEITLAGQGGLLISRVHQVCQKRPFVWERICELQPGPGPAWSAALWCNELDPDAARARFKEWGHRLGTGSKVAREA